MKLRTIWTVGRMELAGRLRRTRDWAAQKVAGMLPRSVRYWSTMGDLVVATSAWKGEVPAMPLDEVLRRLPGPRN